MRSETNPKPNSLSDDAAEKMLANVFEACGLEPSNIPLEKLVSYCEYRREKYSFQKIVLAVILGIFLLLPLCFVSPKFSTVKISAEEDLVPTYEVTVSNRLPIDFVSAEIDGRSVAVYETGNGVFKVSATYNGPMQLKVQLANKQWETATVLISGVDIDSPEYLGSKREGDTLYIYVDDVTGIDVENSYMVGSGESRILCLSYNEETCAMTFPFPESDANIYVADLKGNVLHMILSY